MAASVGKKRVSVALRHIHFVLVILRGWICLYVISSHEERWLLRRRSIVSLCEDDHLSQALFQLRWYLNNVVHPRTGMWGSFCNPYVYIYWCFVECLWVCCVSLSPFLRKYLPHFLGCERWMAVIKARLNVVSINTYFIVLIMICDLDTHYSYSSTDIRSKSFKIFIKLCYGPFPIRLNWDTVHN
jgi:hypothetical protein